MFGLPAIAALPAALALLAPAVAGNGESARWQLDLRPALQLQSGIAREVHPVPALHLGATLFLRRLVDDATPLPLQPFLQRSSALWLRLGGARGPRTMPQLAGSIELGADLYLTRTLVLGAVTGLNATQEIDRLCRNDPGDCLPPPFFAAAALGLRVADLRLDLGYRYMPRAATVPSLVGYQALPEGAPLRRAGGVTLAVRAVLVERIDLRLDLAVSLAGDVYGSFRSDYHPSRRLGLLWGIDFAHGPASLVDRSDANPIVHRRFGARFGLSWWWSSRVGLSGAWSGTWYFPIAGTGPAGVGQQLDLQLSTRI